MVTAEEGAGDNYILQSSIEVKKCFAGHFLSFFPLELLLCRPRLEPRSLLLVVRLSCVPLFSLRHRLRRELVSVIGVHLSAQEAYRRLSNFICWLALKATA